MEQQHFFGIICKFATAEWLRLCIELPVGTAMIFISEKLKDDRIKLIN